MKYFADIKKGLKATTAIIAKHKVLFISLMIVQLIFIFLFLAININYQAKIFSELGNVVNSIEANIDPSTVGSEAMLDELYSVYSSYNLAIYYLKILSSISIIMMIIFNGSLWFLAHEIISHKKRKLSQKFKDYGNTLLKYILVIIKTTILSLIIFYTLFLSFDIEEIANNSTLIISIISISTILIHYIYMLGMASLNSTWKNWHKRIYQLTIKDFTKRVPVFIIINLTITGIIYLTYLTIMQELLFISFFLLMLLIGILTVSKIFWVSLDKTLE